MYILMLLPLRTLGRCGILTHMWVYICLSHVFPGFNWSHRDNYTCHIFSPDTIQDYQKSHKPSCSWKIYSKIFWPDKLDKLAPDLYLKWPPVPFQVYHGQYHQKVAHKTYFHWQERTLAGCLQRKYLQVRELWWLS